jgi:hypothetical protein
MEAIGLSHIIVDVSKSLLSMIEIVNPSGITVKVCPP